MKVKDIYLKTMKFSLIKLGLGALVALASLVLLLIDAGISMLCQNGIVTLVMTLVWAGGTYIAYLFMMNYVGYMIKAAHVAVIAEAVTTGQIPDNMVEYGKEKVKSRFGETNVYLVLDRLVSGAVKQLQHAVGVVGDVLDFIPGVSNVTGILQKFIGISLGYVDECCLGYSYLHDDANPFEAGCDGVVIYFQNAKHLLKNAAITTVIVIVGTFVCWFVPFIALAVLFRLLGFNVNIAVALTIVLAICLKTAFIDSYMLVKMMVSYMEVAPSTEISFDLYDKLCGLSKSFRELYEKAKSSAKEAMNNAKDKAENIQVIEGQCVQENADNLSV